MDPRRLEKCTSPDDKANYQCIQEFIDSHILPTINERLGWQSDYIKFRYSNNNNSSDASNLHRDIILQKEIPCPCYTCITYLDTSNIEVVPGSHRRPFGTLWSAIYDFATNRKVETLHPGDLMIFCSTLLHRGFFSYHISQRRILQIFEIFPSLTTLKEYMKKSIHVTCGGDGNNIMVYISKTQFRQIKLCIFYFLFILMLNVFFLWIIIRTIYSFFRNKRNKIQK